MHYADRDLEDYRIKNMERWGYPYSPDEETRVDDAPILKMVEWIMSLVDGDKYDREIAKEFILDCYYNADCVGGMAMDLANEYDDKFLTWWEVNP